MPNSFFSRVLEAYDARTDTVYVHEDLLRKFPLPSNSVGVHVIVELGRGGQIQWGPGP